MSNLDIYWKAALIETLDIVPYLDVIYTPAEFFKFSRKFYPLEFSIGISPKAVGFCVQKDKLYLLNNEILRAVIEADQLVYSNDVFFVVGLSLPKSYRRNEFSESYYKNFNECRESVLIGSQGRNTTHYWRIENKLCRFKIMIVGATNMGNVGDDLLATSIGDFIKKIEPDCALYFSDFNISKADLLDFNLIIVGGGGLLYTSQFGNNEKDNLSNYFKIPFLAKELSIPCLVLGVGVQGNLKQFHNDPLTYDFLRDSIIAASDVVVRDELSRGLLQQITTRPINIFPDLVFNYINLYQRDSVTDADLDANFSIAFIGEIFSDRLSFFKSCFNEVLERLLNNDVTMNFHYFIMSNDDVRHGDEFFERLASRRVSCQIHDLRSLSIQELVGLFKSMSVVITSRYHGRILSIISGTPSLSIDLSRGKHSLLVNDFFPSLSESIINESCSEIIILDKIDLLLSNSNMLIPSIFEIEVIKKRLLDFDTLLKSHLKFISQ